MVIKKSPKGLFFYALKEILLQAYKHRTLLFLNFFYMFLTKLRFFLLQRASTIAPVNEATGKIK